MRSAHCSGKIHCSADFEMDYDCSLITQQNNQALENKNKSAAVKQIKQQMQQIDRKRTMSV